MQSAQIKNEIYFFYLCLFTVTLLFLSAFALNLRQVNSKVLGIKTENAINDLETAKQINFWKSFVQQNPQYFEGWRELYNLTGENDYLNKAREIDPNRN